MLILHRFRATFQTIANYVDGNRPSRSLKHCRHGCGYCRSRHRGPRSSNEQTFLSRRTSGNGSRSDNAHAGSQQFRLVVPLITRRADAAKGGRRAAFRIRIVGTNRDHKWRCSDGPQCVPLRRQPGIKPGLRARMSQVPFYPCVISAVDDVIACQAHGPSTAGCSGIEKYLNVIVSIIWIVLTVINAADESALVFQVRQLSQLDFHKVRSARRPNSDDKAVLSRVPSVQLVLSGIRRIDDPFQIAMFAVAKPTFDGKVGCAIIPARLDDGLTVPPPKQLMHPLLDQAGPIVTACRASNGEIDNPSTSPRRLVDKVQSF